jgi:hypothetical protein
MMRLSGMLVALMLQNHLYASQTPPSMLSKEQNSFSTEGEVYRNISLPSAVRVALEQDSFVKESMTSASVTTLPENWTECSLIHLSSPSERDYIVIGQQGLTGAHATHFWIYRETPKGMKLVLFAFFDSLDISPHQTKGFRAITGRYYTAVHDGRIHYSFDGNKYVTARQPEYR